MTHKFVKMLDEAFAGIKAREDCPKHIWRKPRPATERRGRELVRVFMTTCISCKAIVVRDTLAELNEQMLAARAGQS
jgi:hypothetical protein